VLHEALARNRLRFCDETEPEQRGSDRRSPQEANGRADSNQGQSAVEKLGLEAHRLDLLVEFAPGAKPTLLDMARIEQELSALLGGRRVDDAIAAPRGTPVRRS
jgi:hypothetical protein